MAHKILTLSLFDSEMAADSAATYWETLVWPSTRRSVSSPLMRKASSKRTRSAPGVQSR